MLHRRYVIALSALLIVLILSGLVAHPRTRDTVIPYGWPASKDEQSHCFSGLDPILYLGLAPAIEYRRQCIQAKVTRGAKRQSVISIDDRFFDQAYEYEVKICTPNPLPPCEPIIVEVPDFAQPGSVDTSALLIGASTNLERLNTSLPQMSRWLSNTTTTMIVIIEDSINHRDLEAVQDRAEAMAMDVTLVPNPIPNGEEGTFGHAQRHFAILHALYTHRSELTKWFGIIDDDTFFPSLPNLLAALAPYDPSESWYIGALSEDWKAVGHFGYMAYGGAGMFFSLPLLETLNSHYDDCARPGYEGDILYRDCVYSFSSPPVPLTQLSGLHQVDFFGDVSKWYESGISPVLSLHHYNGWHRFPVQYAHLVTDLIGVDPLLQRYKFTDDVILTNGYSVVRYPAGLETIDLDRVEGTFLHEKGQFDFSLGALRPALVEGKAKISWRLEHALKNEDGSMRQFYMKREPDRLLEDGREETGKISSVFEVIWSRVENEAHD